MKRTMVAVLMVVAVVAWAATQKKGMTAEAMLGAAIHQQEAEGNLEAAIAAYKRILAEHAGNRAVAAQAQFRLGTCYEKLGQGEARKAYERVLSDYADQPALAAQARVRLAAMERANGHVFTAMSVRRVWEDAIDIWGTVSADGRYLSFVDWSTGDLAVRDLRTGLNRRLTKKGTWDVVEEAEANTISPDGKYVAYAWNRFSSDASRYEIRVIGTDGTGERTIFRDEKVLYLEPHSWSPDLKNIVAAVSYPGGSQRILLIPSAGGAPQQLCDLGQRWPSRISFSPDGRYLAYSARSAPGTGSEDLYLLDLQRSPAGASETRIVDHPARDAMGAWTPDGKYILFASDRDGTGGAWLLPMQDGKPAGPPQLVRSGAVDKDRGAAPMGFTSTGAFYYGVARILADAKVLTVDPQTGKVTGAATTVTDRFTGATSRPIWSPDGRSVLYRAPSGALRIRSLETGEERQLMPQLTQHMGVMPVWHPDGNSAILFGLAEKSAPGIYRVDLATGAANLLVETKDGWPPRFAISPDAATLYYASNAGEIIARDLRTRQEKVLYPGSGSGIRNWALSRDGQYLAFGQSVISILPTSGGAPREVLREPSKGGTVFGLDWSPDGKHLYVLICEGNRPLGELWRASIDGGTPEKSVVEGTLFSHRGIHVHPDGRRIAYTAAQRKNEVWVMENFLPRMTASR